MFLIFFRGIGFIPSNYVRKEPEKKTEVVVAIYDFSGAEQGDLSLIKVCLCKYEYFSVYII